jgi:hypothetical protein
VFRRWICEATSSLSVKRKIKAIAQVFLADGSLSVFATLGVEGEYLSRAVRHLRVLPVSTEVSKLSYAPSHNPIKL